MILKSKNIIECITLRDFGGYKNIILEKRPRVALREDEVRVKVRACGVNINDVYAWQGIYVLRRLRPPFVMGLECSGEVVEVGQGVKGEYKVGDRVMCWNFSYGVWREEISLSSKNCFKIPKPMSYMEAAAFCMNYISAYIAIIDYGNLKPGDVVYIETAAGGVGNAAIQLAKTVYDVTIIGTASPSKHQYLTDQGLKYCFDSTSPDVTEKIKQIYPKGVDIVLCTLIGQDASRNRAIMKTLGRMIHVGASNLIHGERKSLRKMFKVMYGGTTLNNNTLNCGCYLESGFNLALLFEKDQERFRSILKELLDMYEKGVLKPVIDSFWPFTEVQNAIARLLERKNIGKVILVPEALPEFEVGDRVICWNFHYGMWAENISIAEKNCHKIPATMSYDEAAAFSIDYIGAYLAVIHFGNLRSGQTIYIQTAADGLGTAAVQLAKLIPYVTIIGTASTQQHGFLYKLGMHRCFDSAENARKQIKKVCPGGAGNPVTSRRCTVKILRLMSAWTAANELTLMNDTHAECSFNLSLLEENDPERFKKILEKVLVLYMEGLIKPVIDSIWPFSEVRRAMAQLIESRNIGKVILQPDNIYALRYLNID